MTVECEQSQIGTGQDEQEEIHAASQEKVAKHLELIQHVLNQVKYKNQKHFLSPAEREVLGWSLEETRRAENQNKYRTNATKIMKKLWVFLQDYAAIVHSPVARHRGFADFQALLASILFDPPTYLQDRRSKSCARYYRQFYLETAKELPQSFFERF